MKKSNDELKIAIVWEGYEAGGVDSYLSYLLNDWPADDSIFIFHNLENKGIERLQKMIKRESVRFVPVKTTFMYFDGGTLPSLLLKYIYHLFTPLLYIINVIRYWRVFLGRNFDILLAQNGGYPGSYGVLSSCLGGFFAKIPVVTLVVHHAARPPLFGHRLFRAFIEKNLMKSLTNIIAVSEATKCTIRLNTKLDSKLAGNILVIENGVPLPKNIKQKKLRENGKQKLGIIGRLDPHKGHDDFIRALSKLPKSYQKRISVEFIGGYKEEDLNRVSTLISEFGLGDIVSILGYIDRPVEDIIFDLDLVIMATRDFEGFGLTIVESLHCGVPVLATPLGVVPELFEQPHDLIVENGNAEAITRALKVFIGEKDKSRFISSYTRKKLGDYDSKVMAQKYYSYALSKIDKT